MTGAICPRSRHGIHFRSPCNHRGEHPSRSPAAVIICPAAPYPTHPHDLPAVKFYIRTIGCKLNQLDSARVAAALCVAGHELVPREDEAEVVVVNSCTVTANSDRKSRQAANGAVRRGIQTVVMGCGPRARPAQWAAALPHSRVF